ncbi:MAG: carboxymuconolactone decarboxylase family protein [Anaerolineae bacterium]|nr:carboxymuconolactone decarboxylase family protein [Anaerolineae bacterium]
MNAFIKPPAHMALFLKIGIWISKKITGKDMLPARLLAWYPRAAIGSGVLESLVAHPEGRVDERLLKIVRMQASFAAACPFCIDMNSYRYQDYDIRPDEILALRGQKDYKQTDTFSEREKLAIEYTRSISATPLKFYPDFIERLKTQFSEREIVMLASTAAQVNYWARLIQALGVPPAGFLEPGDLPRGD